MSLIREVVIMMCAALGFVAFVLVASYCALSFIIRALDISIKRDIEREFKKRNSKKEEV